jgi:V/A-type H+-transporting ATPase subunit I
VLRRGDPGLLERLRQALHGAAGEGFELRTRPPPGGETAAVVLVPTAAAPAVERAFAEAQVEEVPVPPSYGGHSLAEAIPRMLDRAAKLPVRIDAIHEELQQLSREHRPALLELRKAAHDLLAQREALSLVRTTPRAFVLDGWVPEAKRAALTAALQDALGDAIAVEELSREKWTDASAPVVLSNPRLFRPFEELVRFMPLPRYGTVDPTPFLAVFFPMFFGLMLGDLGYGAALCALAWLLWRRKGLAHSIGAIAGACGAFALVFGALFGELFGDLGRRLFGLHPLLFSREEALVPFLILAVAVGLVHVMLGLVLGAISSLHGHRREALGRGVMAAMVALVTVAILALTGVLPRGFFTPAVIALLVAFPALVIIEGLLGPIELLAALGNVLSYARIMALGTASVMMAVVANRLVGALGSAVVGALLALLFHLVNFALGLFGPTIHALRLQYVEFFGKFYSAGGAEYRPLRPWSTEQST